jgi:5'(3')-deoxyribonucleotidase
MPRPLHILCDLDSIVADLLPKWVQLYNDEFNETLSIADITTFDLSSCVPAERLDKMYSFINGETMASLLPVAGAIETLKKLQDEGHMIHIVSAYTPDQPETATEKVKWVKVWMPWLNTRYITLMSQKHLIVGDVLIDDRPHTIEAYRQMPHGKDALLCTIAYPYNKCVEHLYDCYAADYNHPVEAWEQIYKSITKRAEQ